MRDAVFENFSTSTQKAASVDYLWQSPSGENVKNIWQNVEFVIK